MQAVLSQSLVKSLKPNKNGKPYEVRDTKLKGFILRVQPTGFQTYYCEYARGKREKLGLAPELTPEQARAKAKKILASITLGDDTPEDKRRREKAHDLKSFLDNEYEPWALENLKHGQKDLDRLRALFMADLGNKKLSDVTPWLIEKWRTKRKKAGIAATTINRDIAALRAALSKAVQWNLLSEHPLKAVKQLRTDKTGVVRYLTKDEEKSLRNALKARDKQLIKKRASGNAWRKTRGYEVRPAITGRYGNYMTPLILLSMNTGIRRGEALALTWENVNLKTGMLTVTGATAKSHHTRHIPLNTEAREVLQEWQKQTDTTGYIFTVDGAQLGSVKKAWGSILAAAKITGFRWHDLRHHFASMLVMAGADLYVVKELLGHSTIVVTERYAHLAPEHKQAAVALLDNVQ